MAINEKFLIKKGINQIWAFNRAGVEGLTGFLYEDTFLDNIKLLFSNPIDNILSFRIYPFSVPVVTDNEPSRIPIKIGNVTSDVYAWEGVPQYTFTAFEGYIERYYNNFMDFSPYTKIEIYIPYIAGIHEVNCDEVMGKKLKINYSVDFYTGKCIAYLLVGEEETLLTTYDGQIGVDVQIGGGAESEIARNLLAWGANTALSVGATVATQGALAPILISSSLSGLNAMKHNIQKKGTTQPFLNFTLPQDIIIYINRPRYTAPTNYNNVFGLPLNEERQLSSLIGFTQISEIHLENLEGATLEEIREIKRLLSGGVILSGDSTEFTFTINGESYTSTGATTWETWVNSIYNTGGWFIKDMTVLREYEDGYEVIQGAFIDDYIKPIQYITKYEVDIITFLIDGRTYSAPFESTWGEWVVSSYNNYGWYISNNEILRIIVNGYEYITNPATDERVNPNEKIVSLRDYTTEEVYSTFNFSINGVEFISRFNMTWNEWVESEYNYGHNFYIWNDIVYIIDNDIVKGVEGSNTLYVNPTDKIIQNRDYSISPLETFNFTFLDIDNNEKTLKSTYSTTWGIWNTSPFHIPEIFIYKDFMCVYDSEFKIHRILREDFLEPQTINDTISSTRYTVDTNIYV